MKNFISYEDASELNTLGYNYEPISRYCYPGMDNPSLRGILYQQALEFFEKEYSFFVDVRTDTTPNEILGFDFTIKSWKFPPMYVDVFMDKREGYNVVIKKMIELAKGEL